MNQKATALCKRIYFHFAVNLHTSCFLTSTAVLPKHRQHEKCKGKGSISQVAEAVIVVTHEIKMSLKPGCEDLLPLGKAPLSVQSKNWNA